MKKFVQGLLVLTVSAGILAGCGKDHEETARTANDVMIAQVGDSILYRHQVVSRIPVGLAPSDSAAMFDAIVKTWVENNLLLEYANNNLRNPREIDEMVNRYRNMLIIQEYKRNLALEDNVISEDSVRKWYESHRASYKLERPLIKGVFVKVPTSSPDREKVESLIISDSQEGPEELDDFIGSVAQYTDFKDDWVDWDIISDLIPSNLGNAEEFLEDNKSFKTDYKGMTYLLCITDYILAGEDMPYEYASRIITDNMIQQAASDSEQKIIRNIYDKALKDGKLKMGPDRALY